MSDPKEIDRILSLIPKSLNENKSDIVSLHGQKGHPGYELLHPKDTVSGAIGTYIFEKYGQNNVEKLHGDSLKYFIAGQSIEGAIDSAVKNATVHQVPVYTKGKPSGFFPSGTDLYVGKTFYKNPKDSPLVYAHVKDGNQDKWYSVTSAGKLEVGPTTLPALNKAVSSGTLRPIPYAYGEFEPHTPEATKLGLPDSLDPNQSAPEEINPASHTANAPSAPSMPNVSDPVAHIASDIPSDETLGTGNNGPDFPVWAKGEKLGNVPAGTKLYSIKDTDTDPKNKAIVYAALPDGTYKMFSTKSPEGKELNPQTSNILKQYIAKGTYPEIEQNIPHPNQPNQTKVNAPDAGVDPNAPDTPGVNTGALVSAADTNAPVNTPNSVSNGPSGPTVDISKNLPSGQEHNQPTTLDQQNNVSPTVPSEQSPSGPTTPEGPSGTPGANTEGKKFEILSDTGDSGDGYFATSDGTKLWGKYGAAGVMLRHTDKQTGDTKYLLVQRGQSVSTNKGKWQLPGGALDSNENDYQATARELTEELSPPEGYIDSIHPLGEVTYQHSSGWHYNNLTADVPEQFAPKVDGNETSAAKWLTKEEIASLPLHPALKNNLDDIFATYDNPSIKHDDEEDTKDFTDPTPDATNVSDNVDTAGASGDVTPTSTAAVNDVNAPPTPPDEPTPAVTTKPIFIQGKEADQVPTDSDIYVHHTSTNNPKDTMFAYVKHVDGSIDVHGPGTKKSASSLLKKYVNQDIDSGLFVKSQSYDGPKFGNDISPGNDNPFDGTEAKINVGGVDVTSRELANAISLLKNGPSWQVKTHLKGHPLHKMDYMSIAKEQQTKTNKTLPTKEAVIKGLEDKLGKIASTDAEESVANDDIFALKNDFAGTPPDKVNVGGVDLNKPQLEHAIDAVSNGDSSYPKVNLKKSNSPLANLDMAVVMKAENKKVTESTQAVLLKHLHKKLGQFHTDELSGKELADPEPSTPTVTNPNTPTVDPHSAIGVLNNKLQDYVIAQKPSNKEVMQEINSPPGTAASENLINADGLQVKAGVYKKPRGYFAQIEAKPDGTFYYTGSKKTGVVPITGKKFKTLHESGFHFFVGAPEDETASDPVIEAKDLHEITHANSGGLPAGDYYAHDSKVSYKVFGDGSALASNNENGMSNTISPELFNHALVSSGYVHDKYGNTVIPPGVTPTDGIQYHVFGSKGLYKNELESLKNEVSGMDSEIIKHLKEKYGANAPSILQSIYDTQEVGGAKNAIISKINDMLHSSETKQTPTPSMGVLHNQDAPEADASIFKFNAVTGHAVFPVDHLVSSDYLDLDNSPEKVKDRIKDISSKVGDGKVIGINPDTFSDSDAIKWLASFDNGDMVGVYDVDKKTMNPNQLAAHPGNPNNTATNKIIWESAVKGEVPAGVEITPSSALPWPSTTSSWTPDLTNEYLVKANAQNTDYMALAIQKMWASAHKSGMKTIVDTYSLEAKKFADDPNIVPFGPVAKFSDKSPVPYDPDLPGAPDADWKKYGKGFSPHFWKPSDIDQYVKDYNLSATSSKLSTWDEKAEAIKQHQASIPEKVTGKGTKSLQIAGIHIADVPASHAIYETTSPGAKWAFTKSPAGEWTFYDSDKAKEGMLMESQLVPSIESDITKGTLKLSDPGDVNAPTPQPTISNNPVYTLTNQSGLKLGNNQQTTGVDDQFGNKYIFKPYSISEMFRAESEHGANLVSRMFGFQTAPSQIVEIDDKKGQLQTRHDADHDFTGIDAQDISKFKQNALNDLAKEHLLDWSLDNPDSRALNILKLKNGSVVGIDKGMFGKHNHTGDWQGLYPDNRSHLYEPLVYTRLYDGIKQGLYSQDQIDSMYKSVIRKAREMERIDDSALRPVLGDAFKNAPGIPADQKIDNFLKRKNQLVNDMEKLWGRVYDNTSYEKPEVSTNLINSQGHILHTGFTADHVSDAKISKSYGSTTFFGGPDVEDMHAMTWVEKRASDGGFNVRGELKIRNDKINQIENYLSERATGDPYSISPKYSVHPEDEAWHKAILVAAGNVAFHSDDKQYNQDKLDSMDNTKHEINDLYKKTLDFDGVTPEEVHKNSAQKEMAQLYLGYIRTIEDAMQSGTKPNKADVVKYDYTPPVSNPTKESKLEIEKVSASRAANVHHSGENLALDEDGHLTVGKNTLGYSEGQDGSMYLVTLPTGETIEFRGNNTDTPLALRGLVRYTIPDDANSEVSLGRVQNQLRDMGLDLKPAEDEDFELYYWRHLANIMNERLDSKENGYNTDPKYKKFWSKVDKGLVNKGGKQETDMWRTAFSTLTNKDHIDKFVSEGGHLPQFSHQDIRNHTQATGRPWWKRFDVDESEWEDHQFPTMQSGKDYGLSAVKTGGVWSTEGRVRTFGSWLSSGVSLSSAEDQTKGSSPFIFTRLNIEDNPGTVKVMLSPHVLAKTHTYGYNEDNFGSINSKSNDAYFDFKKATQHYSGSNETMIKDNASLLDDIELVFIKDSEDHQEALNFLRSHGISKIRGIPIEDRIVNVNTQYGGWNDQPDHQGINDAVKKVREWYKKLKNQT